MRLNPIASLLTALLMVAAAGTIHAQNLVVFEGYNFPEGTSMPLSQSMPEADFDNDDFEQADIDGFAELNGKIANEIQAGLDQALADLIRKGGGFESSFTTLALRQGLPADADRAIELLEIISNPDPFIAMEGVFTNTTDEPLDITVSFQQGTLPIPIDQPLVFETFFQAEVSDTGGDGGGSASVFANYVRSVSDVRGPTDQNTENSELELDGRSNLQAGQPVTESSGPESLFAGSSAFLDSLGVPVEEQATIAMSTGLFITDLTPGDSITVRFGYSLGSQDGEIPLFPAEGLVAALEFDAFNVPEPAVAALLAVAAAGLAIRRRQRRH